MKMESHIFSATPMSWVEKMTVAPSRLRPRIASRKTSILTGSRPLKGSSSNTSSGLATTVAINWTFCAMPLDKAWIFLLAQLVRPMRSSQESMAGLLCRQLLSSA